MAYVYEWMFTWISKPKSYRLLLCGVSYLLVFCTLSSIFMSWLETSNNFVLSSVSFPSIHLFAPVCTYVLILVEISVSLIWRCREQILLGACHCQLRQHSPTAVHWPPGWHVCLSAAIGSTRAATKSFHFTFSLSSIIRLRATTVAADEHWVMAARLATLTDVEGQRGGDAGTLVDIRPASFIVRWLAAATLAGQTTSANESRDQPRGSWIAVSIRSKTSAIIHIKYGA